MLGIIILNYNTWKDTVKCIESILLTYNGEMKIYVVDNCSPNTIDDETKAFFDSINFLTLIESKENKGYSAGNNLGLAEALKDSCDFYLISNSDVIFYNDSINEMICFLQSNVNVGIVGPRVINSNGVFQPYFMKSKLTGFGKIKNMLIGTKLSFLVRKFKKKFIIDEDIKDPHKMFGASGCCFMLSKKCTEYLYPLDENTFLYEEEYIIGCKLEKTSFTVYVLPSSTVMHNEGKSTNGLSKFSFKCLINSEQYYLKNYIHSPLLLRFFIKMIRLLELMRIKH